MSTLVVCLILGAAIFAVLAVHATRIVRRELGQGRGSLPGKGHHVIDASYLSGGGGGGQPYHFRVPRDPQDYANLFVPKPSARTGDEPRT